MATGRGLQNSCWSAGAPGGSAALSALLAGTARFPRRVLVGLILPHQAPSMGGKHAARFLLILALWVFPPFPRTLDLEDGE